MSAQAKPYELISDERLQSMIDDYKRKYTRERGDRNVFDTVMALTELREMRQAVKAALKASA